jgi:pimeloyl-[acyl-carrier protein] synthase
MLNTDPPEHRRLRSSAGPLVARRQVVRSIHDVSGAAAHFADAAAAKGELDVLTGYAAPLATIAVASLLGIPRTELLPFSRLARAAAPNLDPLAAGTKARSAEAAADELVDYFRQLIAERRMSDDGGIAALVSSDDVAGGRSAPALTLDEHLATLALVVIGGWEPLAHLICNGLNTLLHAPDQLALLRADPDLWPSAVDELLRLESPIPFTARVCAHATNLGDSAIATGDLVIAMFSAANRDPEIFPEPDGVDVRRAPNPMLAFGAGPHVCLAAPLARAVGRVALSTLVERFPAMTLLDDQPAWLEGSVPRGLRRLPLRVA